LSEDAQLGMLTSPTPLEVIYWGQEKSFLSLLQS